MSIELEDNATHDQIVEFVDQIVEARQGDETDAAKIAAETDNVTAGNGEETAAEPPGETDEKTGEADDLAWIDDDLKAEATAFGIDEDELAEFSSREEFDKAMRLLDKKAQEAGHKAMVDGKTPPRDERGRFSKSESEQPQKAGQYEISDKFKEDFHDDLVNELTLMRDHYEARVAALEARFAAVDQEADERAFDSAIDSLGHADLFGKSGKESPKELQRRQELFVAAKAQQIGLEALGRKVRLDDEAFIARVARGLFADELGKKEIKARTRRLMAQSNSRMGGGAVRPHDAPESIRDEFRRKWKELEGS